MPISGILVSRTKAFFKKKKTFFLYDYISPSSFNFYDFYSLPKDAFSLMTLF
ncbi:hypothetical protein CTRC69_03415 [Chlamydia trachomatis RC-F/69]|nr:hypothetical protein CTRC69_03415 [Chlamydia trachomatis RC-F/69]AGR95926.1 hypothetical protein CTRC852_03450 [Chlamydia trachomatis RC-F(s)/852]AGR99645.1 hypothetical protein CTRC342_03440 [Chlamydia trachomatis RC-F(s)/342]